MDAKKHLIEEIDANVSLSFSRSAGAGGQNVNKVNTKVTARLPLLSLTALGDKGMELLRRRLEGRINAEGELVVRVQEERSQARNREIALRRIRSLVIEALVERKRRRSTKPSKAARIARLEGKRRRSVTKSYRRKTNPYDEG